MAELKELKEALREAHNAGNVEDAQILARAISSKQEEQVGFGENLRRTLVGAARDTAQSTTELIEDITGAEIPDLPTVAEPTYMGGQAIRDIAGFAVPYAGLAKGVSALSKLNKLQKAKKV